MTNDAKTADGRAAQMAVTFLGYGPTGDADNSNDNITADTLSDLRLLAQQVDLAMWHQAEVLRVRGESWQAIGTAMGVSKQAVHKKLARHTDVS